MIKEKIMTLLGGSDAMTLIRSVNLLESLAATTVICSIDREGTIASVRSPFESH